MATVVYAEGNENKRRDKQNVIDGGIQKSKRREAGQREKQEWRRRRRRSRSNAA
jgi:hypothetical protein